jgi:hypothetical protein
MDIFSYFCFEAWPFYSNCIIFLFYKVRKLSSKNPNIKKSEGLVGLTPAAICNVTATVCLSYFLRLEKKVALLFEN